MSHRSFFVASLALAALVAALACTSSEPKRTRPPAPPVALPAADAATPADFPGLHNVVAYSQGLYSGSVPEGDAGFDTLDGMGIRTIISVDGAMPDVDKAKERGIRYVHLPITYGGISAERKLELAKAVKDLKGPVYVHCHHGKHRSAGAAAAVAVELGRLTNEQATARMKVSGTAPSYTGLYACASDTKPVSDAELAALKVSFPERSKPSGFVEAMLELDEYNDQLKAIEKAGWKAPASHPDLVPAAVVGHMADLLRHASEENSAKNKPQEFIDWLTADSKKLEALEDGLVRGDVSVETLASSMKEIQGACKQCHTKYRD